MKRLAAFLIACSCLCFFCVSTSYAGLWTGGMDSGTGTNFSWSDGQSANDIYGTPTLVGGNTFVFTPLTFRAEIEGIGTDIL